MLNDNFGLQFVEWSLNLVSGAFICYFCSAYVNLAFGPFGTEGVPHSHNGFLEILLATGFIGLSVFLIGFVKIKSFKMKQVI